VAPSSICCERTASGLCSGTSAAQCPCDSSQCLTCDSTQGTCVGCPSDQICLNGICQIDPCANPRILVESYITLGFACENVQTDVYPDITDIHDCCRACYATPGCDVYSHGFAASCIVYKNCETADQTGKSDICPVGFSSEITTTTRDGGLPYIAAGPCYPS